MRATNERQDASARARVRALTLHPIAVRSACLKIARMHARWSPTMLRYALPSSSAPRKYSGPSPSPGPPAPDPGLANRLLTTLAHLPALEALTIEWRDPLAAADERAWCGALISALLRALAHRVGELTLVVPYSALGALGITAHAMERLRALAVEIVAPDAAHHGGGAPAVEEGGMEALTTLVNGSSATLVRLEITVRGHSADLASLFGALRSPARLTHLALSIPCDARHLSEPEALARFLGAASTLSGFSFAPTYCCSAPPLGAHHAEDAQDAWYAHAFPKILHAINALTLTLNTTGHSSARVHPALSAPSAACADAHALRLRVNGRIRVLDELRAVLAPFVRSAPAGGVGPTHADANTAAARGRGEGGGGEDSHAAEAHGADGPAGWRGGPEALAIEAHVLGVPLLALLARLLPGLRALEVRYHWVGAAGDADAVRVPFLCACCVMGRHPR